METCARGHDAVSGKRVAFLDNLRTFAVFLVVLYHAGGVYESSGIWASFWIVDDPATNDLCGLVNIVLDIFVMPTLFFVSGYLAPASVERRGGWGFVKAKFKRLMVPWIAAVLTLIPLYKFIFLYSRNLPQQGWTSYFHFSNGIWSQNWLWFLPVLFVFHTLYLLGRKAGVRLGHMSLRRAIAGCFLVGYVYCVAIDMLGVRGWTQSVLLDFQNERVLIYLMVFLLGAHCFRVGVFEGKSKSGMLYHIVNSVVWIPVTAYIFLLLYPWFKPGSFIVSALADKVILWLSYLLSLLCLMYVVIETFRRYQDKQGRLRNALNRYSYYVYIVHVIVLGSIALTMLNTAIPSLLKYLVLAVSTYAVSNLVIYICRTVIVGCRIGVSECKSGAVLDSL